MNTCPRGSTAPVTVNNNSQSITCFIGDTNAIRLVLIVMKVPHGQYESHQLTENSRQTSLLYHPSPMPIRVKISLLLTHYISSLFLYNNIIKLLQLFDKDLGEYFMEWISKKSYSSRVCIMNGFIWT